MKLVKIFLMVVGILTNIAFLYCTWEISLLTVAFAAILFYFSFVMQGAMHEVGHFLAGKMSGYQLVVLQIGRGNIICDKSGKFSLSIRKTRGGQCIMIPPMVTPIKYKAYNAGGIILNAIITLSGIALWFINSLMIKLLAIEIFFSGCSKVITNLIPIIRKGVPTDGYILKLLRGKPLVQKDYAKYLSLYAAVFRGEEVCLEDFNYEREVVDDSSEHLYYKGIQELLSDIKMSIQ